MKTIIAQAIILLAAGAAHAQSAPAAQAAPAVEDRNATQFLKVNVAPATTNPFSGVPVNIEQLQKQLEVSKMQTQLLEEQLRNAGLVEDLKNLPIRKQAEIAQATTQVSREEAQRAQLTRDARAAVEAEEFAREEAARQRRESAEAKKSAARRAADEEKRRSEESSLTRNSTAAPAPVVTRVEVLSVTNVGGKRSALLGVNSNIASVQDGDDTPIGRVSISADGVVSLNGNPQTMQHAQIARVKLSEAAQTTPGRATGSGTAASAPPTLVIGTQQPPESSAPAFVPPPVPGSANGRPSPVPQIQLPSGVSLVPAAR